MNKTIVMVTHDAHAVESARHVTHLEKGELLEQTGVRPQEQTGVRPQEQTGVRPQASNTGV
jgi:ABC-type lipoprotein export system ATPase subunit